MELINDIDDVENLYFEQLELKKNLIQKAIDASYNILPIDEFIGASGFHLPDIMELNSILQFKAGIPVLVTKKLIESFGYSGEYKKQKENLIKLIIAHKLPYKKLSNDEYNQFTCPNVGAPTDAKKKLNSAYPLLVKPNGKSTHILIMPRDLRKLMMIVNTEKGDIMREYCQTLTELFDLYLEYQNEYKVKQLLIKDKKIDEMLSILFVKKTTHQSQKLDTHII